MLQFGPEDSQGEYRLRPAVFGLAFRDGRIACVRVDRGEGSYFDLPGGAIDGEESEQQALIREFVEETGLTVAPVTRLGEAAQRFRKTDGSPVNNAGGFWTVEVRAHDPSAKCEDDHELVWLDPPFALSTLRHEAHAWAVALWLRAQV